MKVEKLRDTAEMMRSANYKTRFQAEYYQLVIRYKKLTDMLEMWDEGKLDFSPNCSRELLDMQKMIMSNYIAVLESRAKREGIILE